MHGATNTSSSKNVQVLLACTEQAAWETLARRRVCHFGYKFEYQVCTLCNCMVPRLLFPYNVISMQSRNVDPQRPTQPFPAALQAILHRLHAISEMPQVCKLDDYHTAQLCSAVLLCNKWISTCSTQRSAPCMYEFQAQKCKCCSLDAGGSMYSQ